MLGSIGTTARLGSVGTTARAWLPWNNSMSLTSEEPQHEWLAASTAERYFMA